LILCTVLIYQPSSSCIVHYCFRTLYSTTYKLVLSENIEALLSRCRCWLI